jgi:hypothetical protein
MILEPLFRFEVPGGHLPLVVQELQTGGTRAVFPKVGPILA